MLLARYRRQPKYLGLLCVVCLAVAWAFSACAEPSKLPTVAASFVGADGSKSPGYTLEVCSTEGQRALGLMYRRSIAERAGMIFVFPDERENSFWMKNTYIPLDMVFLDRAMKVVGILENVPPLNEAPRSVSRPSMYVVEFGAGVTRKHGITEGARLVVDGDLPAAR